MQATSSPEKPVKIIISPDGPPLQLRDRSRRLSRDRWEVVLEVCMPVDVVSVLARNTGPLPAPVETIRAALGDQMAYTHKSSRFFVDESDKKTVFDELVAGFEKDLKPYLQHPQFPLKLVLKRFKDKTDTA